MGFISEMLLVVEGMGIGIGMVGEDLAG